MEINKGDLTKILISDYGNPCGECGRHLPAKSRAYLYIAGGKQTIICVKCGDQKIKKLPNE